MTRKDYVLIAQVILRARTATTASGQGIIDNVVKELCDVLHEDNAGFKPDKFKEACK